MGVDVIPTATQLLDSRMHTCGFLLPLGLSGCGQCVHLTEAAVPAGLCALARQSVLTVARLRLLSSACWCQPVR